MAKIDILDMKDNIIISDEVFKKREEFILDTDSVSINENIDSLNTITLRIAVDKYQTWYNNKMDIQIIRISNWKKNPQYFIVDNMKYDGQKDILTLKGVEYLDILSRYHWRSDYVISKPKQFKKNIRAIVGDIFFHPDDKKNITLKPGQPWTTHYKGARTFMCIKDKDIKSLSDINNTEFFKKIDSNQQNYLPDVNINDCFLHMKNNLPKDINFEIDTIKKAEDNTDFTFKKGSFLDNYNDILQTWGVIKYTDGKKIGFRNPRYTELGVGWAKIHDTLIKYDIEHDFKDMANRIYPYGENGLTIEAANNGKRYIQDDLWVGVSGVREKEVIYPGITNSDFLLKRAKADLPSYTMFRSESDLEMIHQYSLNGGHKMEPGDVIFIENTEEYITSITYNPFKDHGDGKIKVQLKSSNKAYIDNPIEFILKAEKNDNKQYTNQAISDALKNRTISKAVEGSLTDGSIGDDVLGGIGGSGGGGGGQVDFLETNLWGKDVRNPNPNSKRKFVRNSGGDVRFYTSNIQTAGSEPMTVKTIRDGNVVSVDVYTSDKNAGRYSFEQLPGYSRAQQYIETQIIEHGIITSDNGAAVSLSNQIDSSVRRIPNFISYNDGEDIDNIGEHGDFVVIIE